MVHYRSLTKFQRSNKEQLQYRLPSLVAVLLLSAMPPTGLEISTCLFKSIFGLPGPACGLIRSMSSFLHLNLPLSFNYHPLVFVILSCLFFSLVTNQTSINFSEKRWMPQGLGAILSFPFLIFAFLIVWILRIATRSSHLY